MRVKKKWIKNRKPFTERMCCQHWWELKSVPDRLLSFAKNDYYIVCSYCGHRGTLFTTKLDFYEERQVESNLKLTNLRNIANGREEEE